MMFGRVLVIYSMAGGVTKAGRLDRHPGAGVAMGSR
jgi:hypothetical protein